MEVMAFQLLNFRVQAEESALNFQYTYNCSRSANQIGCLYSPLFMGVWRIFLCGQRWNMRLNSDVSQVCMLGMRITLLLHPLYLFMSWSLAVMITFFVLKKKKLVAWHMLICHILLQVMLYNVSIGICCILLCCIVWTAVIVWRTKKL